jgi:hypothetical protein
MANPSNQNKNMAILLDIFSDTVRWNGSRYTTDRQKHIASSFASHVSRTQEGVLKEIVSFYQYNGSLVGDQDETHYTLQSIFLYLDLFSIFITSYDIFEYIQ